mgnify:CR=1 FL=1
MNMLNKIAMVDVYNGANLINNAEIIRMPQLVKYYENQGFKKKRIESIINILLNSRVAHQIKDTDYIVSNPLIKYEKYNMTLEKAIWLYIDGVTPDVENDIFSFNCKYPAILYLSSKDKMLNDTTCFYIKEGEEGSMCRIIDTNYNLFDTKQNVIIVIDNVSQIEKIKLPDVFNITYFATVSHDGKVEYYEYNK